MAAIVYQDGFGSGVWDPVLHQRTSEPGYDEALARGDNVIISRHGAAVSRPGLEYVASTKITEVGGPGNVSAVEFIFSSDTAYIIELGPLYARFIYQGAYVESAPDVPYEIEIPIDGSGVLHGDPWLRKLKSAQSGNVLTITHPAFLPLNFRRVAHAEWTCTAVSFDLEEYPGNVPVLVQPIPTVAANDTTHVTKAWVWDVTAIGIRDNGLTFETAPYRITQSATIDASAPAPGNRRSKLTIPPNASLDGIPVYPDKPVNINFDLGTGLQVILGFDGRIIETRIYRGRGRVLGLVGSVEGFPSGVRGKFKDTGETPDYTQPPPQGRNPFTVFDPADVTGRDVLRTEHPNATTYYEQRAVYGGTSYRPSRLWLSATNNYTDFDERAVPTDDAAIEIELASRRYEEIRALLPAERLLAFTSEGVWSIGGDAPITPTSLPNVRLQSEVGSDWVQPLRVGDAIVYVRAMGGGIQALAYSLDGGGYAGGDLSFRAQHLFRDKAVVSMAYAATPWGVLWVVFDDGTFASVMLDASRRMVAWSPHETDGEVLRVHVIPEGSEHAVYMLVDREGVIGWERMATRVVDDVAEAICLDAAVYRDDHFTSVVTGCFHLEGRTVNALADGNVVRGLKVAGGQVILPFAATKVAVGLPYTCTLQTLPIRQDKGRRKIVNRVRLPVQESRGAKVGQDVDHLTEWVQRNASHGFDALPLETRVAEIMIEGSWTDEGVIVVVQEDPLPLTVLGISREVEVGG